MFFKKITPTDIQKEKMLKNILSESNKTSSTHPSPKRKLIGRQWIVAASILSVAVLLFSGILLHSVDQPSFILVAYAADANNDVTTNSRMVDISENEEIKLPFGIIKKDADPVETTEEQGNKVLKYDSGYINSDNINAFGVRGDDIVAVTYTSEKGMLSYTVT